MILLLLCDYERALPAVQDGEFRGHLTTLLLHHRVSFQDGRSMEFYLKLFWNVLSDRERMGVSAQSDPVRRMAALHRWLAGRFQRAALQRGLANYCRVGVGDSLRVAPVSH